MLGSFRDNLLAYANSRWGRRIFVWSSAGIVAAAVLYVATLGIGSETGTGAASSKFAFVLALAVALPALILFNLALALVWAAAATVAGLFRG